MKKTKPCVCPNCSDVESVICDIAIESDYIYISRMCTKCGTMWDDVYKAEYNGFDWTTLYDKDGNRIED
jgi:RNase P subunit RPR2